MGLDLFPNDYCPSDMLDDFKSIAVSLDEGPVSIAITAYRNNSAAAHPSAAKGGTQDALVIKDALLSMGHAAVLGRLGGGQNYVDVFTGKGTPENIGKVMRLLYDYSDPFVSKYGKGGGPARVCADLLADEETTWQQTLQSISSTFLGLDCNGFVGNWLAAFDHSLKLGPQNGPKEVYQRRKQTRTSVDDIDSCDVVIWANFSHIAAIDGEAGAGSPRFNMCQSAGGGPRMNTYLIAPSSAGKFRLTGGLPAKDVGGEVYIISMYAD